MLTAVALVALRPDVAIVEGAARVRAGRTTRFHVTLFHAEPHAPGLATVSFGDGAVRHVPYAPGLSPHVYDAVATHAYERGGTFAVSLRDARGHVLASRAIVVSAPLAVRPPAMARGADPRAPLIVPADAPGVPLDPARSGILVAPAAGDPAASGVSVPPAAAPSLAPTRAVPAVRDSAAPPASRASVASAAPVRAAVATPSATPGLTTGDR